MPVVRVNFVRGTLSLALDAGAVIVAADALTDLPVVAAPDYAWLSLDPLEEHGLPEIVKVTAHSSGAVTATIERGQQQTQGGGPGREHPSGTFWAHPTTALDLADIDTALGVEAAERATGDSTRVINTQTNDYTLVLADAGKVVEANKATAINVTVPPNASVAFPTGTIIEVNQVGAGLLAVAAGAGVTLNGTLTAPSRYGSLLLRKRATNEWTVTQVPASGTFVAPPTGVAATDTAALQAAATAGGRQLLSPGVYVINATITLSAKVTFLGLGTTIRANAASFNLFTVQAGASGSTIEGVRFEGAATTDATVQFGILTDLASPATNVTVHHCEFTGPDASTGLNDGIKLDTGSGYWDIHDNQFERLIGESSGHGYGVLVGAGDHNKIHANTFVGTPGQGRHAVYISGGASYNKVFGNTIVGMNESAISMGGTAAQPTTAYNEIVGNTIVGCCVNVTTESAAIELFGDVAYNVVAGNLIVSSATHGIILTDAGHGGLCIGNEVAGNMIKDSGQFGIFLLGTKKAKVRGNSVLGSSVSSPGTYDNIRLGSAGSFGTEVCADSWVLNNTTGGGTERNGFQINASAPLPTGTVLKGNIIGTGMVGAKQFNGATVTDSENTVV